MASLDIFVSFEFEKDNSLKNSFYSQARELGTHRVRNCSLDGGSEEQAWKNRAREAIRQCDVVLVLVGKNTHNAPGVLVETDMARSLSKPTIQLLSETARRNGYNGVPHIKDRIPWRWSVINRRLDEL